MSLRQGFHILSDEEQAADNKFYMEALMECRGYYETPIINGEVLGPLVGYAGKDDTGKHFVGIKYYGNHMIEARPKVLSDLCNRMNGLKSRAFEAPGRYPELRFGFDGKTVYFVGAPMGGLATAEELARQADHSYAFPEKKVLAVGQDGQRDTTRLEWGRHEPESGSIAWIVEDVCNNFTTTQEMYDLITDDGSEVVGIVCLVNRSGKREWNGLPIVSLAYIPTEEYEQEGSETPQWVKDELAKDNVVWKPKPRKNWGPLVKVYQQYKAQMAQ